MSCDEYVFWIEFFGDEIDCIREIELLIGCVLGEVEYLVIFLVIYFMINDEYMEEVILKI